MGGPRILLVEDDALVARTCAAMLARLGYDAVRATDGHEAVELLAAAEARDEPIEIALLDLYLPGGWDARDTARRLRAVRPGLRVVLATGNGQHALARAHRQYGFDGLLEKPYRLQTLDGILNTLNGGDARAGDAD